MWEGSPQCFLCSCGSELFPEAEVLVKVWNQTGNGVFGILQWLGENVSQMFMFRIKYFSDLIYLRGKNKQTKKRQHKFVNLLALLLIQRHFQSSSFRTWLRDWCLWKLRSTDLKRRGNLSPVLFFFHAPEAHHLRARDNFISFCWLQNATL